MLYVVMGYTGEGEEIQEWLVAAYEKEQDALKHADLAEEEAERIHHSAMEMKKRPLTFRAVTHPEEFTVRSRVDPRYRTDATGTSYYVDTVELRTEVPA